MAAKEYEHIIRPQGVVLSSVLVEPREILFFLSGQIALDADGKPFTDFDAEQAKVSRNVLNLLGHLGLREEGIKKTEMWAVSPEYHNKLLRAQLGSIEYLGEAGFKHFGDLSIMQASGLPKHVGMEFVVSGKALINDEMTRENNVYGGEKPIPVMPLGATLLGPYVPGVLFVPMPYNTRVYLLSVSCEGYLTNEKFAFASDEEKVALGTRAALEGIVERLGLYGLGLGDAVMAKVHLESLGKDMELFTAMNGIYKDIFDRELERAGRVGMYPARAAVAVGADRMGAQIAHEIFASRRYAAATIEVLVASQKPITLVR